MTSAAGKKIGGTEDRKGKRPRRSPIRDVQTLSSQSVVEPVITGDNRPVSVIIVLVDPSVRRRLARQQQCRSPTKITTKTIGFEETNRTIRVSSAFLTILRNRFAASFAETIFES